MSYEKGKTKTGGRAKGTPNVVNRDLRDIVRELIEDNADRIRKDLNALEPRDRVNAWLKLTEFILPKLQRSELKAEVTPPDYTMPRPIIKIAFRPNADDTSEAVMK